MPAEGWTKMSTEEIRLAHTWYEEGVVPSEIAEWLDRDKSVITRHVVQKLPRKKQGRKPALTEAQIDFLVRRLEEMIKTARCKYHVTAKMLKRSARYKVSERKVRDALHSRGIYFLKMREKPLLTEDDIKARLEFARKYHTKTSAWWNKAIHSYIDGKYFKVYMTGAGRVRAAQHSTYGAYRLPGQGLTDGYVKPKGSLKNNTGARNGLILGGVGGGKVNLWTEVPDGTWNGTAAAEFYEGPLKKALAKQWPGRRRWTILEDNDPTGFKSNKGVEAKNNAKIDVFEIPKRSPDLSVMDYAVWKAVNHRMRQQEKDWPAGRRETRVQYLSRLRKAALSLPREFVEKSVGDMSRRCKRLLDAEGCYFEEGGRRGC